MIIVSYQIISFKLKYQPQSVKCETCCHLRLLAQNYMSGNRHKYTLVWIRKTN